MRLRDDDDKAWLGRSFYEWSFAKCVILIVLGDKSSAGGITRCRSRMDSYGADNL